MVGVPLANAFVRIRADMTGFATEMRTGAAAVPPPVVTPRLNAAGFVGQLRAMAATVGPAIGIAVAGLGIVELFKQGLDAQKEYQTGLAQLNAGLRSTGDVAGLTAEDMEKLADKISGYSGQSRVSIVAGEQLLLTFRDIRDVAGEGNDVFTRATASLADIAARMGGDASGAAVKLGKALNEPVSGMTALKRIGVQFTEDQKNLITSLVDSGDKLGAQKVILAELNTEFGGSAKAVGDTLPGQINKAKNSFKELSGEIVGALAPGLGLLAEGFSFLVKVAGDVFGPMHKFFTDTEAGKDIFKVLAGVITAALLPAMARMAEAMAVNTWLALKGAVINVLGGLEAVAGGFAAAATAAWAFAAANPVLVAMGVVAAAAAVAIAFFGGSQKTAKVDVDALSEAVKAQHDIFQNVVPVSDAIIGNLDKIRLGSESGNQALRRIGVDVRGVADDLATPGVTTAFDKLNARIKELYNPRSNTGADPFKNTIQAIGEMAASQDPKVAQLGKSLQVIFKGLKPDQAKEILKFFDDASSKTSQLQAQTLARDESMKHNTGMDDLTAKLGKLNDALKLDPGEAVSAISTLDGYVTTAAGNTKKLADAQTTLGTAQKDVADKQAAYNLALTGGADNAKGAASALQAAQDKLGTATGKVADKQAAYNDALAKFGPGSTQVKSALGNLQTAQSTLGTVTGSVGDKQASYNDALGKFGAGSDQAKTAYDNLQTAIKGVATAQQAVNDAQPISVASILKRLGLDDATLKQVSAAEQKLARGGITQDAMQRLLEMKDPQAILAIAGGGKSAIDALNKSVGQLVTDQGGQSDTALQKQFKLGGKGSIQAWFDGVATSDKAAAARAAAALQKPFKDAAALVLKDAKLTGADMPRYVANGVLSHDKVLLDGIDKGLKQPERDALDAMSRLAWAGGADMQKKLAASIETGNPLVISKAEATKLGINKQIAGIWKKYGIDVYVDDYASDKLKQIAIAMKDLGITTTAGPAGTPLTAAGQAAQLHLAAGGELHGPGSGTSDSIPLWGSDGEFMVNAVSTSKFLPLLHAINNAGRFAAGGQVGGKSGGLDVILNADKIVDEIAAAADRLVALAGAGVMAGPGQSFNLIIDFMRRSGVGFTQADPGLGRGGSSYHEAGQAVDFSGGDMTAMADVWEKVHGSLLELIHSPSWYVKNGKDVGAGFYGPDIVAQHFNHVHVAASLAAMQNLLGLGGGSGVGSGVDQWVPTILRVLGELGQPASLLGNVRAQMQLESGGNPRAQNNWDSNAAKGQPSKGLMQTIDSTFNAYAGPYRDLGIWNGLANIYAGLNYAAQTGGIGRLHGTQGYDTGGVLKSGTAAANTSGLPEVVLTAAQWKVIGDLVAALAKSGPAMVNKLGAADVKAGNAAMAAAVAEGNGPLQKALSAKLWGADATLYATGRQATADGKVTPAEFGRVVASAKHVTDLTAQLVKMNTVNAGLVTSLTAFVDAQKQFRDTLQGQLTTGGTFTDLLGASGTPGDLKSLLGGKLADIRNFAAKVGALKKAGWPDVIIRDVASAGVGMGAQYADMLLHASSADRASIGGLASQLTGAQLGTANAITQLTGGTAGLTKKAAIDALNKAIYTLGADATALIGQAEFRQRTYDTGGWLEPGTTLAHNNTGRREPVGVTAQTAGPLMSVEHMHVTSQADIDVALRQAEFRQRAGFFG